MARSAERAIDESHLVSATYIGPLPPASEFERYEATHPGAADRILRMAETEQELRGRVVDRSHEVEKWRDRRCNDDPAVRSGGFSIRVLLGPSRIRTAAGTSRLHRAALQTGAPVGRRHRATMSGTFACGLLCRSSRALPCLRQRDVGERSVQSPVGARDPRRAAGRAVLLQLPAVP